VLRFDLESDMQANIRLLSEAIMFGACQQLLVTNRRINRGQTTRASARGRFEVVLFGMLDRARISSTTTALASA